MIWIYRIQSTAVVGYGCWFILQDLPPSYKMTGIGLFVGFWWFFLPGAVNLLNTFRGDRWTILRWVTVLTNVGYLVVFLVGFPLAPIVAATVAFIAVSLAFAIHWSEEASKAKKGGGS